MKRDELKAKVRPIVEDRTLSKAARASALSPIFIEFIPEAIRKNPDYDSLVETFGAIWNNVIAEVVQEMPNDAFQG